MKKTKKYFTSINPRDIKEVDSYFEKIVENLDYYLKDNPYNTKENYIDTLLGSIMNSKITVFSGGAKGKFPELQQLEQILKNWKQSKKSVKHKNSASSLSWAASEEKLDKLYTEIKEIGLIPRTTSINEFRSVFGIGERISDIAIPWKGTNRLFGCLIDTLMSEGILSEDDDYESIIRETGIFRNSKGEKFKEKALSNAKSQYREKSAESLNNTVFSKLTRIIKSL